MTASLGDRAVLPSTDTVIESIGAVLEKFATTCTGEVVLLLGDTILRVWAKTVVDASRNTIGMILRIDDDTRASS